MHVILYVPTLHMGRDLMRITADALHSSEWKDLQIPIVFCRNLRKIAFILQKRNFEGNVARVSGLLRTTADRLAPELI